MPIINIESGPDDERLWPYLNTRDRELAAHGDLFIAEGENLVRRVLASDQPVHSLLISKRRLDEIQSITPPEITIFTADDETISSILGFRFHSGIMACARRPPNPTLDDLMHNMADPRSSIIICPEIHNSENLGSIIRIAAAFNVGALVLGERCCDPWWRRCVRVSMGAVFYLPIMRSSDLTRDLATLKQQWGAQLIATVVNDSEAEILTHATPRPDRLALLVGSESQGLSAHWIRHCDRRVTVPMHESTDSLNVFIATAIFLWHFTQAEAAPPANLPPIPNPPRRA